MAVPGELLLALVYLFIAVASAILLVSPRLSLAFSPRLLAGAGLIAGVVNGATALSGLVLALLFTLTGVAPPIMRATLVAYFFATDLWTAAFLAGAGLFDQAALWRICMAVPLLGIGLWLGTNRFVSAPRQSFRAVTLSILIALCAFGLARALLR